MSGFIKGMDVSTLKELEALSVKYYNQGKTQDLLSILKEYDINAIRLRLWHNPYSEEGIPYGAGTNDMDTTIELGKRALKMGFDFLLDIHYSDFWTDPGKQFVPKAWRGFSNEQLEEAMYDYTYSVMKTLKEKEAYPTMVQIGNELSNGILWPNGKRPNDDQMIKFISAGIRGARALDKEMPIMIHLDNGGNNALYRDWFDYFIQKEDDFQVIGLSYYPFWNGSLDKLEMNMNDIAKRYGKDLIIAEVSMGYTMEDYGRYEQLAPNERKGAATKPELVEKLDYPMTKEGQCDFLKDFLSIIDNIYAGKGKGFYYWEPAWIPIHGSGWATPEALKYIQDEGPCGNEWANQALFDYEGHALPSLQVIKDFKSIIGDGSQK